VRPPRGPHHQHAITWGRRHCLSAGLNPDTDPRAEARIVALKHKGGNNVSIPVGTQAWA